MEKTSPKIIALMEVGGLVLYIVCFATFALSIGDVFDSSQVVPPVVRLITFLTAFVFSALVCSSIILGYPLFLALQGKVEVAVRIVLWCIVWLATLGLILLVYILQFTSAI